MNPLKIKQPKVKQPKVRVVKVKGAGMPRLPRVFGAKKR